MLSGFLSYTKHNSITNQDQSQQIWMPQAELLQRRFATPGNQCWTMVGNFEGFGKTASSCFRGTIAANDKSISRVFGDSPLGGGISMGKNAPTVWNMCNE